MPEQYIKHLDEMNEEELSALLRHWIDESCRKQSVFRMRRAERMIDRIRREYERRGL